MRLLEKRLTGAQTECLLYTRHRSCMCFISFHPAIRFTVYQTLVLCVLYLISSCSKVAREVLLSPLSAKRGNRNIESNLPKVVRLLHFGAGIQSILPLSQDSMLAWTKIAAVGMERSVSFQRWLVSSLDRTR